jgi:predicted amidophosphoribosyltransferase
VKEESTFKKKNVLDEYLQKIDPNYVSKIKVDVNICKCSVCNTEMTLYPSDGIQICENCGNQENILIESDKPSFKDPPMEVCYFSYKRINHYNELLYTTKNVLKSIFKFIIKLIKNDFILC